MTRTWARNRTLGISLSALIIYYWTFSGLEVEGVNIIQRWPQAATIFRFMIVEAEWAYASEVVAKLRETLQIALLGTSVGAVLAVPFGFLGARNVGRAFANVGKFLLNLIRAFPELILAILFTKAVGLGPFPGVLVMGVHSIGMLGKLYAEVVESIDRDVIEAMSASGASRTQAIWFGILPQVLPEFASYAVYRLEINMRAAPVLGMVGAGGIGSPLIFAILNGDWGRTGIILFGIVLLVGTVDIFSAWLRSRLV